MRLIDADELIEHAYRDKLDSRELIADMINNAPTVKEIPVNVPLDLIIKALEQEPKTEWIPVGKELPKEGEEVLVWYEYFRYGDYNCMWQTYGIGWQYDEHFSVDNGGVKQRVIAWCELPKPYSEVSE